MLFNTILYGIDYNIVYKTPAAKIDSIPPSQNTDYNTVQWWNKSCSCVSAVFIICHLVSGSLSHLSQKKNFKIKIERFFQQRDKFKNKLEASKHLQFVY